MINNLHLLQKFGQMTKKSQLGLAGAATDLATQIATGVSYILAVLIVHIKISSILEMKLGMVTLYLLFMSPLFIGLIAGYGILKLFRHKFPLTIVLGGAGAAVVLYGALNALSGLAASALSLPSWLPFILTLLLSITANIICFRLIGALIERARKRKLVLYLVRVLGTIILIMLALITYALVPAMIISLPTPPR